jgi:hypothetical protein
MNYILSLCFACFLTNGILMNDCHKISDFNNEAMHYQVMYGMFNIGEAIILFKDDSLRGGYYIKAETWSTGLVKLFKRIYYIYESCMESQTGLPLSFSMRLEDNRNYYYNKLIFDRYSREDSTIVHSHLSGPHVVPRNIHDILTGFYLFRQNYISEKPEDGEAVVIQTFFIDKLWDLRIRYAGKESINTLFGKVNCLKFKPVTVIGNFFRNDDDMTIWFSDDANHIPLKIKLNLTIGSIEGYLINYQRPKQNLLP